MSCDQPDTDSVGDRLLVIWVVLNVPLVTSASVKPLNRASWRICLRLLVVTIVIVFIIFYDGSCGGRG